MLISFSEFFLLTTGLQEGSEKRREFGSPTRVFVVRRLDNSHDLVDELTSNDGFLTHLEGFCQVVWASYGGLLMKLQHSDLGMHSKLEILMTSGWNFEVCFNSSLLRRKSEN